MMSSPVPETLRARPDRVRGGDGVEGAVLAEAEKKEEGNC